MVAALGSSLPSPIDATTVASAAAAVVEAAPVPTTEAVIAPAVVEAVEPEDQVDEAIASALEGISLALSMVDPLGFSTMCPVSWEPEIQGEPP